MPRDWDEMLARLRAGALEHWQQRKAAAEEIIEAFQTGQIVECPPAVRELLEAFAGDEKWEVRKVVANGLNLIEDDAFGALAATLLADSNAFVRSAADRSYTQRRQHLREVDRQDSAEKRLTGRLARIRERYGEDGAREVVEAGEERFSVLAGSIGHDLRSILTHLRPATNSLLSGVDDDTDRSTLRRKAQRVAESLSIMERCIKDMELYTEPLPIERAPEDLGEVLNVACEVARKNIEELGFDPQAVALALRVPDGLRLTVSRHLLILAVSNLVKNAYESFMARHSNLRRGEVIVEVTAQRDRVEIVIRDNGMGMSADNLAELMARVPRRRNRAKRKSTGFGVPIAHRYIEAHGGHVTFESEEDVGTTVRVVLPRAGTMAEVVQ